jgi:hypothetical protein
VAESSAPGPRPGSIKRVYALLTAYQTLRLTMTGATDHDPDIHPDRASFTIALNRP